MKGLKGDGDVERILVRDEVFERAGARFAQAVYQAVQNDPIDLLAGFIEGDRDQVSYVGVGPREAIAQLLRERFPGDGIARLAAMVRIREPGLIPCAFAVKLSGGSVDLSVIALNIPAEATEASAQAHPTGAADAQKRDAAMAAYNRERDAVLLDPDLNRLRRHMAKHGQPTALEASDEVMRMTWHKARSGATSLPRAERRKSMRWLEKRGSKHFADEGGGESS